MKIIFVLLVSLEANSSITDVYITPGKNIFSHEQARVTINEGTPLIEQQDPIIVLSEEQWLSLSDKIMCPQPLIQKSYLLTTHQFGSFDHHSGHRPVSQLSAFAR